MSAGQRATIGVYRGAAAGGAAQDAPGDEPSVFFPLIVGNGAGGIGEDDGAVSGQGIAVDDIAITGLATDGAESDPGWSYDGFQRTSGIIVGSFTHYYVAEYRQCGIR